MSLKRKASNSRKSKSGNTALDSSPSQGPESGSSNNADRPAKKRNARKVSDADYSAAWPEHFQTVGGTVYNAFLVSAEVPYHGSESSCIR